MSLFADRPDAGKMLASRLQAYAHRPDVIVLALPRGGVPVAYEVARTLEAPLDVFVVRKLGVPGYEEVALGAIASGGVLVLNDELVRTLKLPNGAIDVIARVERREMMRRERLYRDDRPPIGVTDKTAILVDDGLATGSTMRAAIDALRLRQPARIVVAVPVASPDTCADLEQRADEVVCAVTRTPFVAVGAWYEDFSQTTDEEVSELLHAAELEYGQSSR